jgi:hypothetical protein
MVSKNIVQSTLDDDVMTDDEMIAAANKILKREVEKSIKMFNSGFDRGSQIRNFKLWKSSEESKVYNSPLLSYKPF